MTIKTKHRIILDMFWISIATIKRTITHFVHLQVFLWLVSMPILISWGLPLSLAAPVANVLFAPFLTAFLLISSCIFFTSLIGIPNSWAIILLKYVRILWEYLLAWEQQAWLFGFIKTPHAILVIIPITTFLLLHYKNMHKPIHKTLALGFLLIVISFFLKYGQLKQPSIKTIERGTGHVTIVNHTNTIIAIDPGYIGCNQSAPTWVSYTFIPEIIAHTGLLKIDHVIAMQPNIFLFQALTTLCAKISVKHIYLPWWEGMISKKAWFAYKDLQNIAQQTGCIIHSIKNNKVLINFSNDENFVISPLKTFIPYCDAQYPALQLEGTIDKQNIILHAQKYRLKTDDSKQNK